MIKKSSNDCGAKPQIREIHNGAKSLEIDQKAGIAVTLFSWGKSQCFGSASSVKSEDLRAYDTGLSLRQGGCSRGIEGALFSM